MLVPDSRAKGSRRTHVLLFDDPEGTLRAVHELRGAGFEVADVHSPFPLHGIDEALDLRPTRLAWATLVGGLLGGSLKLVFQSWVHVVDWPMNIGGKPEVSLPALVPVTFELTVLVAAFATLGALFVRRGLHPWRRGARGERQPDPRVTDDRFAVVVLERHGGFDPRRFLSLAAEVGAREVLEGRPA